MHCPNCGEKIKKSAKFCLYCGHPLADEVVAQVAAENAATAPLPEQGTPFAPEQKQAETPAAAGEQLPVEAAADAAENETDSATTQEESTGSVMPAPRRKKDHDTAISVLCVISAVIIAAFTAASVVGLAYLGNLLVSYSEEEATVTEEIHTDTVDLLTAIAIYDGAGQLSVREEYEYDGYGNNTRILRYSPENELIGWTQSSFDEYGMLLRSKTYDADGNLLKSEYYYYYTDNTPAAYEAYDANEMLITNQAYVYDDTDKLVKVEFCDENDDLTGYTEYSQFVNDLPAMATSYDLNGTPQGHTEYIYDAAGNTVSEKDFDAAGQLLTTRTSAFDAEGNITMLTVTGTENSRAEYTYEPINITVVQPAEPNATI